MIKFGNSLRAAREVKGFTIGQISELTRMAPTVVQDLENENFTHIAAPIYGRGFVKLYCEAVGLDPKPYIDEFMEIFGGNRDNDIRERPLTPATDTSPATSDVPAAPAEVPQPAPPPESDLFQQTPLPSAQTPLPSAQTTLPSENIPAAAPTEQPSLSRYAAPIRQTHSALDPQALWRLGVLAAAGLVVLLILFFGIRAVYRATTHADTTKTEPASVKSEDPVPAAPVKDTAGKTTRTPQKIPSLYID